MGLVCCKEESRCDLLSEIKKGSIVESSFCNSKYITDTTSHEQIILKQKENPLKDYSLLLFQELNKFRLEPHKYYVESIQYNLTNIVKELIKNKNDEQNKKDLELKWSSKNEIFIYDVMKDKKSNDIMIKLQKIKERFEHIFDLIILYVIGSYNNIKESLWKVLKQLRIIEPIRFNKIITDKIDYCVIYSIQSDKEILKNLYNKEKRKILDNDDINFIQNIEKYGIRGKIISFYFLFTCLDNDNKNINLENSDVIYW